MVAVAVAGALSCWLGAAAIVLFESRLPTAGGVALVGIGLSLGALTVHEPTAAVIFAVAAITAAVVELARGAARDAAGPTTAGVILALGGAAAAAWAATFLLDAPGGRALRISIVVVIVLLGGALLSMPNRANRALTGSALALAMGAAVLATPVSTVAVAFAARAAVALDLVAARAGVA